jgi:hypothetical protein
MRVLWERFDWVLLIFHKSYFEGEGGGGAMEMSTEEDEEQMGGGQEEEQVATAAAAECTVGGRVGKRIRRPSRKLRDP